MEMLTLFDSPEFAAVVKPPAVPAAPREVKVTVEIDQDLIQDLQKWKPKPETIKAEIEFLTTYFNRFGFAKDSIRLKTLQYWLDRVE